MKIFNKLIRDEQGATAIEYGLIAALIGASLIGALQLLEGNLSGLFNGIGTTLSTNTPS